MGDTSYGLAEKKVKVQQFNFSSYIRLHTLSEEFQQLAFAFISWSALDELLLTNTLVQMFLNIFHVLQIYHAFLFPLTCTFCRIRVKISEYVPSTFLRCHLLKCTYIYICSRAFEWPLLTISYAQAGICCQSKQASLYNWSFARESPWTVEATSQSSYQ